MKKNNKAPTVTHVDGVMIQPMEDGQKTYPSLVFVGDTPEIGTEMLITMPNGVVYSGTVTAAVAVDSDVVAEFGGGLTPAKK